MKAKRCNIDKVNVGTRVTFGGRPVGEVVEIRELVDEANPRKAYDGVVYIYELTLAIDTSTDVYNTDEISLRTSGLLGDKSVNIAPLPPKKGEIVKPLTGKEIIYANEGASVEDTLKDFKKLADKMDGALTRINATLDHMKDTKMIDNISGTFANVKDITGSLNEPRKWKNILANVDNVTADAAKSWPKVDQTLDDLRKTAANADVITQNVREGKGTVGRALMTDDLYLQLSSILSRGETVMNDINHYGVLFHLDKNWQRLRARRVNLLQRLSTPQEFRNFFNDEVDHITTALSRVNMILEETGGPCNLICNFEFSKVFAELLRRTEEIEENLQLYNTQLNDCRVKQTEFE
jgi:phospholipid/cholesterol/gamma-HCH transport system substrate-binding protein